MLRAFYRAAPSTKIRDKGRGEKLLLPSLLRLVPTPLRRSLMASSKPPRPMELRPEEARPSLRELEELSRGWGAGRGQLSVQTVSERW